MAEKDVNIHIRSKGTDATKRDIDGVGASTEDLGKKTEQAGKKTEQAGKRGAKGTEEATRKLGGMSGILTNLTKQVGAFFGAWLGFQGVQRVISWLIEKLERIATLQGEIYDKSVQLSELGQALEMQTGTVGKQQYWTEQVVAGVKAGGLRGPGVAKEMMTSMDIVFAEQGGIKDAGVLALYKELAPFVGAAQMTGGDVAKLFEFAGTVGVEPKADAYKDYFGKVVAGYTASKATDFGAYMIGLQKGATGWIAKGGSFKGALSIFSAARAATSNEALAANLLEQTVRMSGGGYEKPVKAMERGLGVKWSELSMDERADALMEYVRGLPESTRDATLTKQGFPLEIGGQIGKLVGPEATRVYADAIAEIESSTPEKVAAFTDAYMDSMLGKERVSRARISEVEIKAGPEFASWQRRIREAKAKHKVLVGTLEDDRRVWDRVEPIAMAMQGQLDELEAMGVQDDTLAERYRHRVIDSVRASLRRVRITTGKWIENAALGWGFMAEKSIDYLKTQATGAAPDEPAPPPATAEDASPPENVPDTTPPPEPVPAGDLTEGQPVSYNTFNEYYDYSIRLNPVAGNREDRLIGARFDPYA